MDNIWEFGNNVFSDGLLNFIITAAVTWLLATLIVKAMRKANEKRAKLQGEKPGLQMKYVYRTLRFMVYCLAAFYILSCIKPLASLGSAALGVTSILAVGVSLAAQQSFGNYISGFFLALYQPYQIGDFIRLKDQNISGTVQEMTFRHTVLHTIDNTTLIVPNSTMNSAIIEDTERHGVNYVKWMSVGVGYDSDFETVKKIITHVVTSQPGYIDERTAEEKRNGAVPVTVRLDEFQDSSLLIKFKVCCRDCGSSWQQASDIRVQLKKEFDENGINIPFPITTVVQKETPASKN